MYHKHEFKVTGKLGTPKTPNKNSSANARTRCSAEDQDQNKLFIGSIARAMRKKAITKLRAEKVAFEKVDIVKDGKNKEAVATKMPQLGAAPQLAER